MNSITCKLETIDPVLARLKEVKVKVTKLDGYLNKTLECAVATKDNKKLEFNIWQRTTDNEVEWVGETRPSAVRYISLQPVATKEELIEDLKVVAEQYFETLEKK
jgi:hypothetical protein